MTATGQNVGTSAAAPFVAGDHRVLRFTAKEADDATAMDLVGCTVRWRLFPWPAGPKYGVPATTPVVSKSNAASDGITVTDPAGGLFEVTLLPADTSSLVEEDVPSAMYWHEAEVIDASDRVYTVSNGQFLISFQRVI